MAQEVSIGDVVELNSGGPKMTIASIQPEDVRCVWFGRDANAPGNKKKPVG